MDILSLYDYLLLPFYLVAIYVLARRFRERHYPEGHPWRKYFMPGLFLKIGGAIFIVFIYVYYYGVGDSLGYFRGALVKNEAFWDSPLKWINLIFEIPDYYEAEYYDYTSRLPFYKFSSISVTISLGALLGIVGLNSYLITSLLFGVLSFTGLWALFRTFARQYPNMIKQVAYAVLYFPSVIVWGSGLFKDTICMFALGWLVFFTFRLLIERRFDLKGIIELIATIILIALTKLYILLALVPALLFWVLTTYASKTPSIIGRILIKTVVPLLVLGVTIFLASSLSNYLGVYSLDTIAETSENLRNNILADSEADQGSGYDLGDIGSSPTGLLLAFPKAINVTLFRPYVWEVRKVITLLSALESFGLLLLTLYVFFKVGFIKTLIIIRTNSNVQFCLIFTLVFAFAVGISTFNFGTLSRYKIPCLPFYGLFLAIVYQTGRNRPLFRVS